MSFEIKIYDDRLKKTDFLKKATSGAAAFDLYACCTSPVHFFGDMEQVYEISAGFSIHINDPQYAMIVIPRSSFGVKTGGALANTVGLVDSDYQGLIKMFVRSFTHCSIHPMQRIAQMLFIKVESPAFKIVDNFSESSIRGEGGFGSTGKF